MSVTRTSYTLIYLSLVFYTGKEATGWAQEADMNPTLSHSDTKAYRPHPFTPPDSCGSGPSPDQPTILAPLPQLPPPLFCY